MFIALRNNRKGFFMFLSYSTKAIRPIRPIRGKKEIKKKVVCSVIIKLPQHRQISLLSQEFWIVPQKRIGKSLLNEEKGIPLQPQTRKLHSETLTY